jgi:hypothetical protein
MPFLTQKHKECVEEFGEDYDSVRPDLWDEYAIEEPDVKNKDEMVWCPMHFST